MKRLRFVVAASGSLFTVAGFLFACSSDDTIVTTPDSGTPETGADTSTPDSGLPDSGQTDSSIPDTGTDTGTPIDAGLTLDNYETKLAAVLCQTLSRCCFGDANLGADAGIDGGGHFDLNGCLGFYKQVGFQGASGEIPTSKANLVLDQTKGNDCVTKLTNLTCTTPGAEFTALATACYGAVVGKLAAGASCTKDIECQPGNFCSNGDGGTGACTALRAVGGNCGDWFPTNAPDVNAEFSGSACSYRGKGILPGTYCDVFDFVAGDFKAQADWKCAATQAAGATCPNDSYCKDSLCDDNTATCVTPRKIFAQTPPGSQAGCGKFASP